MSLIAIALLSASAYAQSTCSADVLVDDFSVIRPATVFGELKQVNLLGGDYGAAGASFTIMPETKSMTITSGQANIGQPEPQANPGTAPTFNYWFTKFDQGACFNLAGFSAIQFDLIAPVGSNMNFTMTQKSPNCSVRYVDSIYQPLTKYITPNGQKQTVTLPISDFTTNLIGGQFDFVHLKDWTIVNLSPANAQTVFVMSNLVLKGGPSGCVGGSATATATAGASATASATPTGTFNNNNNKSNGAMTLTVLSGLGLVAVLMALI